VEAVPAERARFYNLVTPVKSTRSHVFEVEDIVDKPRSNESGGNWALAARFVFSPAIFAAIRNTRPARGGELQLADAIRILLRQGGRVQAMCLSPKQRRHDIGNFGGYFRAFLDFALSDEYFGEEVRSYLQEALARQDQGKDEE
jgi:UTP--glucose-1-phosphate uridylyltransferase